MESTRYSAATEGAPVGGSSPDLGFPMNMVANKSTWSFSPQLAPPRDTRALTGPRDGPAEAFSSCHGPEVGRLVSLALCCTPWVPHPSYWPLSLFLPFGDPLPCPGPTVSCNVGNAH